MSKSDWIALASLVCTVTALAGTWLWSIDRGQAALQQSVDAQHASLTEIKEDVHELRTDLQKDHDLREINGRRLTRLETLMEERHAH